MASYNDLGDIIKNDITVTFGRGRRQQGGRICCFLARKVRGYEPSRPEKECSCPRHFQSSSEGVLELDSICPRRLLKLTQVTVQK